VNCEWLKNQRVSDVVMEATGPYWRPVWNVLEGEIPHLMLVNPQHVKALAGRKTDRIDSRRLAHYLERGELEGSFIPPRPIRELRDLTRCRVHLVEEVNRVKNRISGMCETGNIKVASVATDLFGASGRCMLHAVVEGNRDAGWMAGYAQGRLRRKLPELALALEGDFTAGQRWLLGQELGHLKSLEEQIVKVQAEIGERMRPYEDQVRHLITIPGVDRIVAWTIVAELGTDMSVFPDARHAASWSGMCPGNRESAGRQLGGRTRKANSYLRRDLCQAAWAASHTKGKYLAALYRRLRIRCGHGKAIFAVAHQILIVAYQMLLNNEDYKETGESYFDIQNKPKVVNHLVRRLTSLGFYVTLQPGAEPLSPDKVARNTETTAERTSVSPTPPQLSAKRGRGRPCKCASRGIDCKHKFRSKYSPPKTADDTIASI